MIQLIGPGGAGKSTIGALLAERLDIAFLDLGRADGIVSYGSSGIVDSHGNVLQSARELHGSIRRSPYERRLNPFSVGYL
jgi:cytidylate kinase